MIFKITHKIKLKLKKYYRIFHINLFIDMKLIYDILYWKFIRISCLNTTFIYKNISSSLDYNISQQSWIISNFHTYSFSFLLSFFFLYIYIYVFILYNDKFPENNGQKWIVNYLQSGTKCETVRSMCHF